MASIQSETLQEWTFTSREEIKALIDVRDTRSALELALRDFGIMTYSTGEFHSNLSFRDEVLSYTLRIMTKHENPRVHVLSTETNTSTEFFISNVHDISVLVTYIAEARKRAREALQKGSFGPPRLSSPALLDLLKAGEPGPGAHFAAARRSFNKNAPLDCVMEVFAPFKVHPHIGSVDQKDADDSDGSDDLDGENGDDNIIFFRAPELMPNAFVPAVKIGRLRDLVGRDVLKADDSNRYQDISRFMGVANLQAYEQGQEYEDSTRGVNSRLRCAGFEPIPLTVLPGKIVVYDFSNWREVIKLVERVLSLIDSFRGNLRPFHERKWTGKHKQEVAPKYARLKDRSNLWQYICSKNPETKSHLRTVTYAGDVESMVINLPERPRPSPMKRLRKEGKYEKLARIVMTRQAHAASAAASAGRVCCRTAASQSKHEGGGKKPAAIMEESETKDAFDTWVNILCMPTPTNSPLQGGSWFLSQSPPVCSDAGTGVETMMIAPVQPTPLEPTDTVFLGGGSDAPTTTPANGPLPQSLGSPAMATDGDMLTPSTPNAPLMSSYELASALAALSTGTYIPKQTPINWHPSIEYDPVSPRADVDTPMPTPAGSPPSAPCDPVSLEANANIPILALVDTSPLSFDAVSPDVGIDTPLTTPAGSPHSAPPDSVPIEADTGEPMCDADPSSSTEGSSPTSCDPINPLETPTPYMSLPNGLDIAMQP